jgi:hypothetical protein
MGMEISKNSRHFIRDGKPFFWLGDTAWLLFRKLSLHETQIYLKNRALKGFSVIQSTLVHEDYTQNTSGSPALLNEDFSKPNPDTTPMSFWSQVEETVRIAASYGLVMAFLPAWGSFYKNAALNEKNIGIYTDFLAKKFGNYENIIWLVGGDIRGDDAYECIQIMGQELRRKCPHQLIGFHPFGRCSSSQWFHNCTWLDFNMFQSGHRDYTQLKLNAWDDKVDAERWVGEDNYRYVLHDWALHPAKPTLDGEPSYELIPHGLHDSSMPYWQACDVRRYAYWSVLSGSAGHTYGDNAIMQFWSGEGVPVFSAIHPWQEALHNTGSMQMMNLRRLMEILPWHEGKSCQEILVKNLGQRYDYHVAFAATRAVCVYSYSGSTIELNSSLLPFADGHLYWFDPVIGGLSYIGEIIAIGAKCFSPPKRRTGQEDWVLLITKEALRYPLV